MMYPRCGYEKWCRFADDVFALQILRVCDADYITVALQPTPHQSLRDSFFLRKLAPFCRYATFPLTGESPQGEALIAGNFTAFPWRGRGTACGGWGVKQRSRQTRICHVGRRLHESPVKTRKFLKYFNKIKIECHSEQSEESSKDKLRFFGKASEWHLILCNPWRDGQPVPYELNLDFHVGRWLAAAV